MLSFDAAYCNLKRYDMSHDADFTPDQSVESVSYLSVEGSRGLSVIFPPWHAPEWLLQRKAKQENALGYSALYLTYSDNVLSSDAARTVESFDVIADRVADEVIQTGEHPERWTAYSLGASMLMYTLGTRPLPARNIDLVAPGGDLAKSVFTGRRTAAVRCQFVLQGIRLEKLQTQWEKLGPTYQADKIEPTRVNLSISHADKIIPPDSAFELTTALIGAGHEVDININRPLGHYGTILASTLGY